MMMLKYRKLLIAAREATSNLCGMGVGWFFYKQLGEDALQWSVITGILCYLYTKSLFNLELVATKSFHQEIRRLQEKHDGHQSLTIELRTFIHSEITKLCKIGGENYIRETFRRQWMNRELAPVEVGNAWREILFIVEQSVRATSYVKIMPGTYPAQGWLLQKGLEEIGKVVVRRVFIVNDYSELNHLPAEAKSCGTVKYITRTQVDRLVQTQLPYPDSIRTIDFGIFDDKYLFIWNLDDNRALISGSEIVDRADPRFERYRQLLDEIHRNSEEESRLLASAARPAAALAQSAVAVSAH